MELLNERRCRDVIQRAASPVYRGRIDVVSGVLVEAVGVPAAMGELCRVELGDGDSIEAEVIGFKGDRTLLMPHGDLVGLSPGQAVHALGRGFGIQVSDDLLGRVLDGFGNPLDDRPPIPGGKHRDVRQAAPRPLDRRAVDVRGGYGLGVHALGQDAAGRDLNADGRARTFLPWVGGEQRSLPVSVVLPLWHKRVIQLK